jgi:hypothetical protein
VIHSDKESFNASPVMEQARARMDDQMLPPIYTKMHAAVKTAGTDWYAYHDEMKSQSSKPHSGGDREKSI